MTLYLSAILMILIAVAEAVNLRIQGRITFLTAAHGLIVIGYCLPPFILHFVPGTPFEDGIWGHRLYILDLATRLNLADSAFITGWLLITGGYAVMLVGYVLGRRFFLRPFPGDRLSPAILIGGALVMGLAAAAALAVYASQFHLLRHFVDYGMYIRGGRYEVKWGYLQVLAQLAFPAFLMATGAALQVKPPLRTYLVILVLFLWSVAALRTFHSAGRFELGSFLMIPLLAWIFTLKSRRTALIGTGIAALLILFVAMAPHSFFRTGYTLGVMATMFETLGGDLLETILFILSEYAYPYFVAAHTVTATPEPIATRYFIDLPLGFLHMLPSFSGVDDWPPMILSLHIQLLPWIPVDLVSFGYYSLGTIGVLITFAAFGVALALFDSWLTCASGWLGQALRAAWLFYLPFRLFYADPYVSAQVGFGLISATIFLAIAQWWTTKREKAGA